MRKQHYYNQVHKDYSQRKFLKGWLNRLEKIEQRAVKLIKEPEFSNIYSLNQKTPFDDDYKGVLNKVENISNKEKEYLKNKYEYILNRNNKKSNILNVNSSSNQDKKFNNFSVGHWVIIDGNHVFINS